MLIVNLNSMPDSQVVGVVMSKGAREDCLYEMSEMLYQIMTRDELIELFNESLELVQARITLENK